MSFQPTIRMVITTEAREQIAAQRIDLEREFGNLVRFFQEASLNGNKINFTADVIEDIKNGEQVTDFTAVVVGRFTKQVNGEDVLHLNLATGDIVAVQLPNIA